MQPRGLACGSEPGRKGVVHCDEEPLKHLCGSKDGSEWNQGGPRHAQLRKLVRPFFANARNWARSLFGEAGPCPTRNLKP